MRQTTPLMLVLLVGSRFGAGWWDWSLRETSHRATRELIPSIPRPTLGNPIPLEHIAGNPRRSEDAERKVITHVLGFSCDVSVPWATHSLPSPSSDATAVFLEVAGSLVIGCASGTGEEVLLKGSWSAPHNETHANVDFFEIDKHDPMSYLRKVKEESQSSNYSTVLESV
jgi:hypothetical protein